MRLNKTTREQIIRNWKSAKWDDRISKAYDKFVKAHLDRFNKKNELGIDVLRQHPELHELGFLTTSASVNFNYHDVRALKRNSYLYFKLDNSGNRGVSCERYAQSYQSVNQIDLIESEVKKFYKLEELLKSQQDDVTAIVYSCTTVEKLLELAPQFKKYIPKTDISKSNLPVPMDTVNRVKGIL